MTEERRGRGVGGGQAEQFGQPLLAGCDLPHLLNAVEVVHPGGDHFKFLDGTLQVPGDLLQRGKNAVTNAGGFHFCQVIDGVEHARFGVGEVEEQCRGAEPFHIPAHGDDQFQAAQGVEDGARPAVFAQHMLETIGERDTGTVFHSSMRRRATATMTKSAPGRAAQRSVVLVMAKSEPACSLMRFANRAMVSSAGASVSTSANLQPLTAQFVGLQQIGDLSAPESGARGADEDNFHDGTSSKREELGVRS